MLRAFRPWLTPRLDHPSASEVPNEYDSRCEVAPGQGALTLDQSLRPLPMVPDEILRSCV